MQNRVRLETTCSVSPGEARPLFGEGAARDVTCLLSSRLEGAHSFRARPFIRLHGEVQHAAGG